MNTQSISVLFALVASVALPASARATVASDLCTGNPCVVSSDIVVDSGSILDFTGQSLVFAEDVVVRVGEDGDPLDDLERPMTIVADDITIEKGARILGDPGGGAGDEERGDRAAITLQTLVGDLVMESQGNNRSEINVKATLDDGGSITLLVAGDAILDGEFDLSANYEDALGGDLDVEATGSVTFGQDVTCRGQGNFAGGGDIRVQAGQDLTLNDLFTVEGEDFGGGDIDLVAVLGTVTINDRVFLDGGNPDGEAGELNAEAGTDFILGVDGLIQGHGGAGADDDCGDGAFVDVVAGNHIEFHGDVSVRGGFQCFGGEQLYETRLDFIQHPTSSISSSTGGGFGASGGLDITADRSVSIGKVDLSADGFASDATIVAPHVIEVYDKISVRGSGNPEAIGGRVELRSCTIDILDDGELDARSALVFNSFGTNVLKASGLMTVDGQLRASEPTVAQPNVGNFLFHAGTVPVVTGPVSPTEVVSLDSGLPVCGYCGDGITQTALVEVCDDGNTASCDGCAGFCQRVDDVCGDGIVECGEECDDGNLDAGDGCEPDCTAGPLPTPSPTPAPTPDPTPEPTPSPSPEPTPEPTPDPTPSATPEPTPEPTPSSTPIVPPTPSPTPDPTPTPEPTPDPTPTPTPEPTPDPTPTPTPEPTPTAGPTPVDGLDFYGITPCRVINTIVDIPQGGGAPAPLLAGVEREFPVAERCGIPATARAIAGIVTVVQPTANGFVTLWPADESRPTVSAVNFESGDIMNNNLMLKLAQDESGAIRAFLPVGATDLIFDVNGYFE